MPSFRLRAGYCHLPAQEIHIPPPEMLQFDATASLGNGQHDRSSLHREGFRQPRRFTSDCPHELRTPLAMIRSVGEVGLQKNLTPEESRNCIASMLEEVDRLASLVDALLMITRPDAGNVPVQRAALRVMEVAREAANLFGVLIEEKSLRLVLEGDEHVEVEAYRVILKEALVNIIHNAVNYSPAEDAIVVRVLNRDATQVTVEVEDQGPGIPLDDQV